MPVSPVGVPPNLIEVLAHLESDGLVAFPTETVWGLAARAESRLAVERLQRFKGRSEDRPISVLVEGARELDRFGVIASPVLRSVVDAFWPGPLTLVARAETRDGFAPGIAGPNGAVGFRCSDHPIAALLAREALARDLGPLTATSFNRAGETPVGTYSLAVLLAKSEAIPRVIPVQCGAQDAFGNAPSTVLDLAGPTPQVLRWGAVSAEMLAPLLARFC